MDSTLTIKNLDGKDLTIEVIDIIEDSETGKEFICYKLLDSDDTYVSTLVTKEDSYTLESVTPEEKKAIEEHFNSELEGE